MITDDDEEFEDLLEDVEFDMVEADIKASKNRPKPRLPSSSNALFGDFV